MDNELSVRAGRNIGIEPTLLPFVQAAAGNIFTLDPNKDVIVAEHTDQAARVFFVDESVVGFVWNTNSAPTTDVLFLFRDELGNEILFASVVVSDIPGPEPIHTDEGVEGSFACLAPGEQIVARITPGR
jgi:hypothetical protein